jgi:ATP-binding cassette subfamily F protein 3
LRSARRTAAESGEHATRRLRIASVAQETPALSQPAIEYVLDGDVELRETEQALAAAESSGDGHAIADLHAGWSHRRL